MSLGRPQLSRRTRARRAANARAALQCAQGMAQAGCPERQVDLWARLAAWSSGYRQVGLSRAVIHLGLLCLVGAILSGELLGGWSQRLTRSLGGAEPVVLQAAALPEQGTFGVPISLIPRSVPTSSAVPVAPALERPVELNGAFQFEHVLADGETLGGLATQYGISLDALVWTNNLDQGDALSVGQVLRIPRVSGLTHIVAEGETVEALARQFGVAPEAITTFRPNGLSDNLQLRPGVELFIPGGVRPINPDWLRSIGGPEGLMRRGAEPSGQVRQAKTNLRTGPSTAHPQVAYLAAGRQVALRARHEDWLEVQLGPDRGWVRQDMLNVSPDVVATLPETSNFPPPPPRWVWPARGQITSGFGPRWGGLHNGLDIANRAWTPIVAARSGRVSQAGWCRGYGYCVMIIHDGGMKTIYGHLIAQPVVAAGDEVAAGQLIGNMGSTYDRAGGGYSTGVHLHFTLYVNGKAVDPLRFLP